VNVTTYTITIIKTEIKIPAPNNQEAGLTS